MPTAVFTDANIDFGSAIGNPSSVNWTAVAASWAASMNGNSGVVAKDFAGWPFPNAQALAILGTPHDNGSVPATITMTDVLVEFDWVTTNVCVGNVTRITVFGDTSGNPMPGNGVTSAHFSEHQDPTTYLGGTDRAALFAATFQWAFLLEPLAANTSNGIAVSNFTVTITYDGGATVTDVFPDNGDASGGYVVNLTGTGFTGATTVLFGDTPADNPVFYSDTQAVCIAPEHAVGEVTVTVQ